MAQGEDLLANGRPRLTGLPNSPGVWGGGHGWARGAGVQTRTRPAPRLDLPRVPQPSHNGGRYRWGLWKEEDAAPLSGECWFGFCLLLLQHRNCTQRGLCFYTKNTSKRSCPLRLGFMSCLPPGAACAVWQEHTFQEPRGDRPGPVLVADILDLLLRPLLLLDLLVLKVVLLQVDLPGQEGRLLVLL